MASHPLDVPKDPSPAPPGGAGDAPAGRSALTVPGVVLGLGLGGFVDGIVLHQLLQWHHVLTSEGCCPGTTLDGLEANTLADGVFHSLTLLLVSLGLFLLWRALREGKGWAGRRLVGMILVGWGLFNVVEGVVDHHILGLHHVKAGDHQTLFDLSFLALGVLLVAGGTRLARAHRRTS